MGAGDDFIHLSHRIVSSGVEDPVVAELLSPTLLSQKRSLSMHCCKRKAEDSSTQLVHPVLDPSKPESRFRSEEIRHRAMFPAKISHAVKSLSWSEDGAVDSTTAEFFVVVVSERNKLDDEIEVMRWEIGHRPVNQLLPKWHNKQNPRPRSLDLRNKARLMVTVGKERRMMGEVRCRCCYVHTLLVVNKYFSRTCS